MIKLHEKFFDVKDETIEVVKVENELLFKALGSLEEVYDEDRKIITALTEQIKLSQ